MAFNTFCISAVTFVFFIFFYLGMTDANVSFGVQNEM